MLRLGSKNINQCSEWQQTDHIYITKLYKNATEEDLEATVTELMVACFKVIGRRWGVFFFFCVCVSSVLEEKLSPP